MMQVARITQHGTNRDKAVAFYCPGCRCSHVVPVEGKRAWGWNGSTERPTLTPSLLTKTSNTDTCHLFVTDGQIRFLGDCTHDMAGKTVPMEPE